MKRCPDCGTKNSESADFCSKCSAELPRKVNTYAGPLPSRQIAQSELPPETVERLQAQFLKHLNVQMAQHRSGVAAALSAILPGLGQIYSEAFGKGFAMILAWVIGAGFYARWVIGDLRPSSLSRYVVDSGLNWDALGIEHIVVGLLFVVFWIVSVIDACAGVE